MLPWLIAGWILFGQKPRRGPAQSSTSPQPQPAAAPTPGFLFRLPDDGYETTRMAVALGGKPQQVGIFQNPAEALKVAAAKGWAVPPDVRPLEAMP